MYNLLVVWLALAIVGFMLMYFREDYDLLVSDMISAILGRSIFMTITVIIFYYVVLPVTIPHSLVHVFRKLMD